MRADPKLAKGERLLIIGGAESGKSTFAESLLAAYEKRYYIATAEPGDTEMADKIRRHVARRDQGWITIEAPVALPEALAGLPADDSPVLVDCLTFWLANIVREGLDWQQQMQKLLLSMADIARPVIFVSNELGMGLVPANQESREFRKISGQANQLLAAHCSQIYLVVAGKSLLLR